METEFNITGGIFPLNVLFLVISIMCVDTHLRQTICFDYLTWWMAAGYPGKWLEGTNTHAVIDMSDHLVNNLDVRLVVSCYISCMVNYLVNLLVVDGLTYFSDLPHFSPLHTSNATVNKPTSKYRKFSFSCHILIWQINYVNALVVELVNMRRNEEMCPQEIEINMNKDSNRLWLCCQKWLYNPVQYGASKIWFFFLFLH